MTPAWLVLQVGYIDEEDEEELQGGIDVEGGDAEFDAAMEEYLQDAQDSILAHGVSVKKGARALEDDVPVEGGVDVKEEAEAQRRRQVTGGPHHTTRAPPPPRFLSLSHTPSVPPHTQRIAYRRRRRSGWCSRSPWRRRRRTRRSSPAKSTSERYLTHTHTHRPPPLLGHRAGSPFSPLPPFHGV